MDFELKQELTGRLARFVHDTLKLAEPPLLNGEYASVEELQTLHGELLTLRAVLYAASTGDFSQRIEIAGYLGATLKALQANLRHMTWQTTMVASGDFTQRVEFLGEFADSFNTMVVQLDQTLTELRAKKDQLSVANAELLREITVRKKTEAALRKSQEELQRLAMTDALTGLYNRHHFNRTAEEEIERALRYKRSVSVVLFDIDFFKGDNDNFGHCVGDQVLQMIAKTTRAVLRASEVVARYGGEEFIILFPETGAAKAALVAERLRAKLQETTLATERGSVAVTASFGVSDALSRSQSQPLDQLFSELVSTADRAMYASKATGRNRVTIYDADLPVASWKSLNTPS